MSRPPWFVAYECCYWHGATMRVAPAVDAPPAAGPSIADVAVRTVKRRIRDRLAARYAGAAR